MPIPTPFHPRTAELCTSLLWKEWAGYHAVCSYDTVIDREYFALRHAAGMIDVSPLYKVDVRGADAAGFLSQVTVRDVSRLRMGRATYGCWCDDEGMIIDDGMVLRLGEAWFRLTSAEPCFAWIDQFRHGYDISIEDVSRDVATLSIQGPTSRAVVSDAVERDLSSLRYFGVIEARIGGAAVHVSRTGYTGDLGFEIWLDAEQALGVWDSLVGAGRPHGLTPAGLDAMDVTRVEAGFVLNGIDYFPAHHCLIDDRKSTPDELGLGWTVDLERDPFNGQAAIRRERERGPRHALAGLVLDWDAYEALFEAHGLPPSVPPGAWRDPVPVYARGGRQIGYATSGAWSPTLKQNLALATVEAGHEAIGNHLEIEVTVEYVRHRVSATVSPRPFFDPERKRA